LVLDRVLTRPPPSLGWLAPRPDLATVRTVDLVALRVVRGCLLRDVMVAVVAVVVVVETVVVVDVVVVGSLSFLCLARLSRSANVTSLSGAGVAGVARRDGEPLPAAADCSALSTDAGTDVNCSSSETE